jgi:hypothetical protein
MVDVRKFTAGFFLYALVSFVVFLMAAFTGSAGLAYLFIILPFYIICLLYCLSLGLKDRRGTIKVSRRSWCRSLICQCLVVLTSPADCYGWHQGRACYSFLQTHLQTSLGSPGFQSDPPHWGVVEGTFPIAVLLYILSIAASLREGRLID